ncbi:hypothetical protein R0K17_24695, partial [Planococcus sp. SIMBA_143]
MGWGEELKSFWKDQATSLINGTGLARLGIRPTTEEQAAARYLKQCEDRGAAVIRIKNKGILLSKKGFSK